MFLQGVARSLKEMAMCLDLLHFHQVSWKGVEGWMVSMWEVKIFYPCSRSQMLYMAKTNGTEWQSLPFLVKHNKKNGKNMYTYLVYSLFVLIHEHTYQKIPKIKRCHITPLMAQIYPLNKVRDF